VAESRRHWRGTMIEKPDRRRRGRRKRQVFSSGTPNPHLAVLRGQLMTQVAVAHLRLEIAGQRSGRGSKTDVDPKAPQAASTPHEQVEPPVTTWKACAEVNGVSVQTLSRRRKEAGCGGEPWWASKKLCKAWYKKLIKTPSAPTTTAAPKGDAKVFTLAQIKRRHGGG
jgi:hypothetical protein